jgi:peptide-methionine (S)-S-oxide reductase
LQIDFDPEKISYRDLLDIFWSAHDPAAKSWSTQYRASLFYHNDKQKELAMETREGLQAKIKGEIFTDIKTFTGFYPAEDYHQKHALQHSYEFIREFKVMYPSFRDIVSSTAAARVNGYLGGYGTLGNLQAELDTYGLSPGAAKDLLEFVKASNRYSCQRSGAC